MSVLTIVLQAYATSFPLTGSIALLAIQLSDIVDAAFVSMDERLRESLRRSVVPMRLPSAVEARVVAALHKPPASAISVVRGLLPDFATMLPQSLKTGSTLAPIMFVLLLCLLVMLQVFPFLMFGLAGNGDLVILMCLGVCAALAQLALASSQVLALAVGLVEAIINFLIQYLLRKVLNVRRLQAFLDLAHDPKQALGLARRTDASVTAEVSTILQWRVDETIRSAGGMMSYPSKLVMDASRGAEEIVNGGEEDQVAAGSDEIKDESDSDTPGVRAGHAPGGSSDRRLDLL